MLADSAQRRLGRGPAGPPPRGGTAGPAPRGTTQTAERRGTGHRRLRHGGPDIGDSVTGDRTSEPRLRHRPLRLGGLVKVSHEHAVRRSHGGSMKRTHTASACARPTRDARPGAADRRSARYRRLERRLKSGYEAPHAKAARSTAGRPHRRAVGRLHARRSRDAAHCGSRRTRPIDPTPATRLGRDSDGSGRETAVRSRPDGPLLIRAAPDGPARRARDLLDEGESEISYSNRRSENERVKSPVH